MICFGTLIWLGFALVGVMSAIIDKTNRMNDKVMELEAKLNMSFDEKEKRKARNEINYVYSDYKYDFYKNAVAECEDAMSRLKAQIGELEYSNSYSDIVNASMAYARRVTSISHRVSRLDTAVKASSNILISRNDRNRSPAEPA